jgi:hypothetical protein
MQRNEEPMKDAELGKLEITILLEEYKALRDEIAIH